MIPGVVNVSLPSSMLFIESEIDFKPGLIAVYKASDSLNMADAQTDAAYAHVQPGIVLFARCRLQPYFVARIITVLSATLAFTLLDLILSSAILFYLHFSNYFLFFQEDHSWAYDG